MGQVWCLGIQSVFCLLLLGWSSCMTNGLEGVSDKNFWLRWTQSFQNGCFKISRRLFEEDWTKRLLGISIGSLNLSISVDLTFTASWDRLVLSSHPKDRVTVQKVQGCRLPEAGPPWSASHVVQDSQ